VNINLVAINIFMTIADYLAAEKNQVVLWSKLFEELVKATIDNRPEVRHASLRTLAFCMTSCGDKFDKDAWNTFISQALLPVLYNINEEASKAEANPNVPVATETSGDSLRRKQVQIMVHHSRNTAAKQWSETRSLTIENISRIVKEHGSKDLSKAEMFEELCIKFIDFLHQSVQTKTTEITKSSTRYLQEMLLTCTDPALKIIWKGAWLIWETIADFALSQDISDANTITFLADGLLELYNSRKDIFSQEDINHVIQLAHKFIVCPAAMNVIMLPSTIQKTFLSLITTVCHYSDETYDQVFKELASILPSRSSIENQLQIQERERFMKSSNLPPPKTLQPPVKLAIAVQKDLVECVMNAPDTVQKRLYHHLVNVLGAMMLTKYVIFTRADPNVKSMTGSPPFFYPLWKSTIKHFESVISNSSKHFDKESNIETVNNMWFDFCQAVETFLFPASNDLNNEYEEKIKKIDKSDSDTDEELGIEDEEIQLIRLIEKYALPHCQSASGDVKKRILSILERATHNSPKPIAAESLKCIFRLIKEATDACIKREQNKELSDTNIDHLIEIGQYLIPMTLTRCKEILKAFLKEDQRTGLMPLPRYRREEVLNVLNELSSVQVHALLFEKCQQQQIDDKPSRLSSSVLSGPKGLIIRLFPILCDFVATTDNSIKTILVQMFKIVSSELGLSEE
jgi:histone H3/H4